jgi:hypothetical protein
VATYRTSFTSPLKAADVFVYMARFSNAAEWDPGVLEAQDLGSGPPRRGSTYRLVVRFLGRQLPLDYEIVEIDAPRRVVLRAENSTVRSTDVIEVAPAAGGGARVTYTAALRPRGAAALMAPLISLLFRRIGDRATVGLRAKLEA